MRATPSDEPQPCESIDVLVIGGGINGAGIARDAAGRGLRVLLCEKGDLGGATSSSSTKLIHGGLRYLEHYDFALVRHSLREREVLLRAAPHIIWPLRFVLPHHRGLRPAWLLRLGLFLYDHLGGRELLPPTRRLSLRGHHAGECLQGRFETAFEYSDCWVDDARLVVLNALDAHERGAEVAVRTRFVCAERDPSSGWQVTLSDATGEHTRLVHARSIVNTAGPWAGSVATQIRLRERGQGSPTLRLVKGSHIVVPRLHTGEHAYLFQGGDGRVVFAIPYEGEYTLIGTTESDYEGDPAAATADAQDIDYLCGFVNDYFAKAITADDVVWTYAGVRALDAQEDENATAASRDYDIHVDDGDGAPRITVVGGKITTFRVLAEDCLAKLTPLLGCTEGPWTRSQPLPGGDIPHADFDAYAREAADRYPWLPAPTRQRLLRAYGTRLPSVLGGAQQMEDLGESLGAGLTEAELHYLRQIEWAQSADDVLWRRSKLGLHMSAAEREAVAGWMARQPAGASASPSAA